MTDVDPKGPTQDGVALGAKPTQLQRAIAVLPDAADLENIRANYETLREVVIESRHDTDESISQLRWNQLRSIDRRLSALLEAIDEYVVDGGELGPVDPGDLAGGE